MAKALIIYYSRTGNTKKMADYITDGLKREGISYTLVNISDAKVDELLDADAIIIGSPTYYGSMASQIKNLLDESVRFHGELGGKVGAAFTSSANIGGGNETTIMDILKAFLIHGMIIQGDHIGDHYGPVAIGAPDQRAKEQCMRLGTKIGKLLKRLTP